MKFAKKHRVKQLSLICAVLFGSPIALADYPDKSLTPTELTTLKATPDYKTCLTDFAANKSGQNNDWCYIEHNKFFNSLPGSARTYNTGTEPLAGVHAASFTPAATNPTVHIDQGHYNFHKIDGEFARYLPFKTLLNNDGYKVEKIEDDTTTPTVNEGKFTYPGTLTGVKILVIANPVHSSNSPEINWISPIRSAYTQDEINALVEWVKDGGSLMLIADHYPFPGSVDQLAQKFGFYMDNGYHFDPNYNDVFLNLLLNKDLAKQIMSQEVKTSDPTPGEPVTNKKTGEIKARTIKDNLVDDVRTVMVQLGARVNSLVFWAGVPIDPNDPIGPKNKSGYNTEKGFSAGDGWLTNPTPTDPYYSHPIVNGIAGKNESIPYVTSFTGQSFKFEAPDNVNFSDFTKLMTLGKGTYNLLTTAQDAYFGVDSTASENNVVTGALTDQKVPAYTADYKATYDCKTDTTTNVETCTYDYLQGAAVKVLKDAVDKGGKVIVFGEAGMFTAQIAADQKSQMGFNHPLAYHNQKFVLNTIHWLDGSLTVANDAPAATSSTGLETELIADVKDIASLAQATKDDRFARDNYGTIAGQQSYAVAYKDSYSGTDPFGCSISQGGNAKDPTLLLLSLFALGYLFIPRKQRAI